LVDEAGGRSLGSLDAIIGGRKKRIGKKLVLPAKDQSLHSAIVQNEKVLVIRELGEMWQSVW